MFTERVSFFGGISYNKIQKNIGSLLYFSFPSHTSITRVVLVSFLHYIICTIFSIYSGAIIRISPIPKKQRPFFQFFLNILKVFQYCFLPFPDMHHQCSLFMFFAPPMPFLHSPIRLTIPTIPFMPLVFIIFLLSEHCIKIISDRQGSIV